MSWFGYDQGVFSGVLISSDFKHWFPETKQASISGITSSCFAVGQPRNSDGGNQLTSSAV
jgi:hypothetical protein